MSDRSSRRLCPGRAFSTLRAKSPLDVRKSKNQSCRAREAPES
jgi:hypothetical protein